jgi:hypothetical protein
MDSRHFVAVLLACPLFAGGCLDDALVSDSGGTAAEGPSQNVVIAAVGLDSQPGTLRFTVPAGTTADITGARLRWVGRGTSSAGDATILINGHQRTGVLIASQNVGGDSPWMFLYEYDATALVRRGINTLFISGFDLGGPMRADGVAVAVSYNDPSSPWTAIHWVEPNEFVSGGAGAVWDFPIGYSSDARNGRFVVVAADCANTGTDRIWWSSGPGAAPGQLVDSDANLMSDRLMAGSGNWIDVVTEDLPVPARAAHFAYQLESPADGSGDDIIHLLGVLCIDGEPSACAASVSGRVWRDDDLDGIEAEGEPGLAGVTVALRAAEETVATGITDADGAFAFDGLCAGDYVLVLDEATLPDGFVPTTCAGGPCSPFEVTLEGDDSAVDGLAFGWGPPLPEDACFYRPDYWRIQYGSLLEGARCELLPPDLLYALLEIVQATTARDWSHGDGSLDPVDAVDLLKTCSDSCGQAERNYLACLLNFAFNGAHRGLPVDTDGDGEVDSTMGAAIDTIEPLLATGGEGSCDDIRDLAGAVNETPSSENCTY